MLPEILKEGIDFAERQLLAWDSDVRALLSIPPKEDLGAATEEYRQAQSMVHWDPRPEAFSTVVALADVYLSADASVRKGIREVVARAPRVAQELFPLMGRCADRLRANGDVQWLRRGIAIAAISDGYPDWRDLYGELGHLYG
ncbi:MAG: hypothetical protein M3P32_05690, partial [Chloroflexota bacterium]|nr:hypothetical protein [Chloroflexota bacterium]